MELRPAPLEALAELKRIGVGVLLDDFGTGYSSLSWLSRLPVDGVKVDRAFVSHVSAPTDPVPILTAVTQIGKELGMAVIAEGVETADQLAVARAVGVDWVQGFYVARPAAADSAADLRALMEKALSVSAGGEGAGREAGKGELVGIGAVAELLGMSVSSARRLADSGMLPSVRTAGGHRRFERRVLERFSRERLGEPSLVPRRLPAKPLENAAPADPPARPRADSTRPGRRSTRGPAAAGSRPPTGAPARTSGSTPSPTRSARAASRRRSR